MGAHTIITILYNKGAQHTGLHRMLILITQMGPVTQMV